MASFSARRQLGHRAAVVRDRRGRRPGRSRSRPSPRGASAMRAGAAALEERSLAGRGSTRRSRRRRRARCPAGASRSSLARFSPSVASLAGEARRAARRARRRAPPPRCPSRRRSAAAPVAAAAARALGSALAANVVAGLGRQLDVVGQRDELVRRPAAPPSSRTLCALRVARTSLTGRRAATPPAGGLQGVDALGGERQQVVEMRARQRRALGRRLDLDRARRRRS